MADEGEVPGCASLAWLTLILQRWTEASALFSTVSGKIATSEASLMSIHDESTWRVAGGHVRATLRRDRVADARVSWAGPLPVEEFSGQVTYRGAMSVKPEARRKA